jgi:hypothetical protein
MKKLKIKNWTSCIQDCNKWKLCVEEEEEEEEKKKKKKTIYLTPLYRVRCEKRCLIWIYALSVWFDSTETT